MGFFKSPSDLRITVYTTAAYFVLVCVRSAA
jgi:hypothetical protein